MEMWTPVVTLVGAWTEQRGRGSVCHWEQVSPQGEGWQHGDPCDKVAESLLGSGGVGGGGDTGHLPTRLLSQVGGADPFP